MLLLLSHLSTYQNLCFAGILYLSRSTFPGSCPAPFWTRPESQRLTSSPLKACGMRIKVAGVEAEGAAVVGMAAVVGVGMLWLMLRTEC